MGFLNLLLGSSGNKELTEKSKCPKCNRKGFLHEKYRYGERVFWCAMCGRISYPDGSQYIYPHSDIYIYVPNAEILRVI